MIYLLHLLIYLKINMNMIMTIALITLIVLELVSAYIIYNMYTNMKVLEYELYQKESLEENTIELLSNILSTFVVAHNKIKRVDKNGSFEADDEVGFTFKVIRDTIVDLRMQIEDINKQLGVEEIEDGE